jgi:serine/threonine protein kinase
MPEGDPFPPHHLPPPSGVDPGLSPSYGGEDDDTVSLPVDPHLDYDRPGPNSQRRKKETSHRDDIIIPDYTLLKRIGSGAYGEVWMAQSVTGALRAVKIVWREDFELTRTFHREFEGIQQFEPISRGHPCLVHILHVGWNEKRGFYYCVMELADDAEHGPSLMDIHSYVPRTLSTDLKRHGRLDPHYCQEQGIYLADALNYMHERGLAHRDIKPSNIIFVDGVCKLADIGLVAVSGERSFVGTEGFVPPEGPGTPAADIYSLGKVLYEMSSGKDRMEFPEVPLELSDEEWPVWLDLNRVICKACAPDLKERFASAGALAEALQQVGVKRSESWIRRFSRAAIFTVIGSACLAGTLVMARYQHEWSFIIDVPKRPVPMAKVRPSIPTIGRPWQNSQSRWFLFKGDRHIADLPLEYTPGGFKKFLDATNRPFEGEVVSFPVPNSKNPLQAVLIQPSDADAYCAWMTAIERDSGHLDIEHEYAWKPMKIQRDAAIAPAKPGVTGVRCEIVRVYYGRLSIDSTPRGAEVYDDGFLKGRTPLILNRVRADKFNYEIRLPGYAPEAAKGTLKEGQLVSFNFRLRSSGAVVFTKPWKNSLGMNFVPLQRAMLSVYETRRQDFAEFVRSTGAAAVAGRVLDVDPTLPVTNVSRIEAELFCRWLTDRERAKGLIQVEHEYRLPTDDEWSLAVDLPRGNGSPEDRNLSVTGVFPWGFIWPPLARSGNFADASVDKTGKKSIAGYNDTFPGSAPVGSFPADSRGVRDLAGNVWEWVADSWNPSTTDGVARGGGYTAMHQEELLSSYRRRVPVTAQLPDLGFRVLLTTVGIPARPEE